MWTSKVFESSIWESKAWIALERIIGLIGLLILLFGIWNTLLKNESKQAERDKKINATLEETNETLNEVKKRMKPESWQKVEPLLDEKH